MCVWGVLSLPKKLWFSRSTHNQWLFLYIASSLSFARKNISLVIGSSGVSDKHYQTANPFLMSVVVGHFGGFSFHELANFFIC
jgi:hypothetical protein